MKRCSKIKIGEKKFNICPLVCLSIGPICLFVCLSFWEFLLDILFVCRIYLQPIIQSVHLSFCLSTILSFCLSIYCSVVLSLRPSVCNICLLFHVCLSFCLFVCLCIVLLFYHSVCSICLVSLILTICRSFVLSVHLPFCLLIWLKY